MLYLSMVKNELEDDNQISLQKGDMILSDKIKDPLNGNKTFAKVGKHKWPSNNQEKILIVWMELLGLGSLFLRVWTELHYNDMLRPSIS